MPALRKFGLPIALVIAVVVTMCVMFWPLIRTPSQYRYFGYGDSWTYYGPTAHFVDRSIHDGELPLWNPLMFCGQPIAGNPQYLLFYPPNLLRSYLTPDPTPERTHVGLALSQFFHALLAALGAYVLGRRLELSYLGAAAGALAFTFSAALSQRMFGHQYMLYVASWWPWALYSLHNLMNSENWRGRLRWSLLLGATYAFAVLGGSPQTTYMVGVGLVLYWLVTRVRDGIVALRKRAEIKAVGSRVGRDAVFGVLAILFTIGLAMPLLGPAAEFTRYTPRGIETTSSYEAIGSEGTWTLPELLTFYGGSETYDGFKTLSATGLILCVAGLLSWARPVVQVLAALSLLFIYASLEGSLLHDLLVLVAPFSLASAGRGMIIGGLPLGLLAGFGVQSIAEEIRPRRAVVISVLVATTGAAMTWLLWRRLGGYFVPVSTLALVIPGAACGVVLTSLWLVRKRWLGAVAILILLTEAVLWRNSFIHAYLRDTALFYSLGADLATASPSFWNSNSRGVSKLPNTSLYSLQPEINGYDPLFMKGISEILYSNQEPDTFARGVEPFSMARSGNRAFLLLKRGFWLHRQYADGPIPPPERNFAPTTTAIIRDSGKITSDIPRVEEIPNFAYSPEVRVMLVSNRTLTFTPKDRPRPKSPLMWQNRSAIPPEHKTLAIQYRSDAPVQISVIARATDGDAESQIVAGALLEPTFDVTSRYDLPMPDLTEFIVGMVVTFPNRYGTMTLERVELIVDEADELDRIEVISRTPNTVEVELIDLPGPRILSHIDFMYPGWHAYLDGSEVPILTAFSHFKAVEVPAGTHRVRFEFRPRVVTLSIATSIGALAVWIALLVWSLPRNPKEHAT